MTAMISDPSCSVSEVNVPEITDISAKFIYNYYAIDERSREGDNTNLPLEKVPRYVEVSWQPPRLSVYELTKKGSLKGDEGSRTPIADNASKIISEDNYANQDYVTHTFSDIGAITQGSTDLENYSRLSYANVESVYKMARQQIEEFVADGEVLDSLHQEQLPTFVDAFNSLANFPRDSLGLRVYDDKMNLTDEGDLLSSISNNLSLNVKVNSKVIPDIFNSSTVKSTRTNLDALMSKNKDSRLSFNKDKGKIVRVDPVTTSQDYIPNNRNPVKIIGYSIERYLSTPDGFKKEKTHYIESAAVTHFYDLEVIYGQTYIYAVKVIASVNLLAYGSDGETPTVLELFVSSRPTSSSIECFEYSPPPPPDNIRFVYDYLRSNLLVLWDMPVNSQQDIKQFQVFRRSSIKAPFELIAQYGFDKTYAGQFGEQKYTTSESVDGNNLAAISPENSYLIKTTDYPVFVHKDEDFVVDTEFFESPTYIYCVCSIDAHGMISNYSTQHEVTFDPYKNKLVMRLISDAGAPRPYPNMNLKMDAFKDIIKISGNEERELSVYFNPEYLSVVDDKGIYHKIVDAVSPGRPDEKPYYVLQLINLDNQKYQLVKIEVKDPKNLTIV
jgi:hypothetical protein